MSQLDVPVRNFLAAPARIAQSCKGGLILMRRRRPFGGPVRLFAALVSVALLALAPSILRAPSLATLVLFQDLTLDLISESGTHISGRGRLQWIEIQHRLSTGRKLHSLYDIAR